MRDAHEVFTDSILGPHVGQKVMVGSFSTENCVLLAQLTVNDGLNWWMRSKVDWPDFVASITQVDVVLCLVYLSGEN